MKTKKLVAIFLSLNLLNITPAIANSDEYVFYSAVAHCASAEKYRQSLPENFGGEDIYMSIEKFNQLYPSSHKKLAAIMKSILRNTDQSTDMLTGMLMSDERQKVINQVSNIKKEKKIPTFIASGIYMERKNCRSLFSAYFLINN